MTEKQIIEWAREAKAARDGSLFLFYVEDLQCFASLVAAHAKAEMKKRCAKVCSDVSNKSGGEQYDMFGNNLAEQCENAIRALKD